MKKNLALLCLAVGVLALPARSWAISVTTTNDSTLLVNTILGGGGVTVSNIVFQGSTTSAGTFTGGTDGLGGGIGIASGILLTSGNAALVDSENNSDASTGLASNAGDADLETIIPASQNTTDATVLQFDFVTTTGAFSFDYVFASEEYNEFTNTQFNDVFGFFLSTNGGPKTNIALIPGTSTAVSINNVNGGGPIFGTNPSNPQFFNNNDLQNGGPFFANEYDGFTDVFSAGLTGLTIGQAYTIKLAISDTSDTVLDSGVFIKGGSFTGEPPTEPPAVPEPATLVLLGSGLLGLAAVARRKRK